jgi:hypothetical protein
MMSRALSRLRRGDDRGTSLILSLIFITVGTVVLTAILSLADASMRTTIALRSQAANAAAADGAAKLAINALRQGTYTYAGGNCFGSGPGASNTLTLPNFYQPAGSTATSAAVTCDADTTNSALDTGVAITPANRPGSAILTMAALGAGEDGVKLTVAGGRTLRVHGDIYSNSTINIAQGTLETNTAVTARGACTGTITSTPAPQCNYGSGPDTRSVDPNWSAPSAAATPRSVPPCVGNNKLVTFSPGLYTDVSSLNSMMRNSGCKNSIFHFLPGTFYFNFPSATEWLIDTGYLVAGTPTTPLVAGTPPSIPGACQSPIPPDPMPPGGWVKPGPNAGVQFVFGGGSHLRVKAAEVEICGTYSATSPPIAVYGLKSAVGAVPAQSGCVTATPYPTNVSACAVIKSDNSPNSALYVQGTTYAPRAAFDISLNNLTGQVFRFGIVARTLLLSPTGSAELSGPVIEVPDETMGAGMRTVIYLNIYICPNAGTCTAASGLRRLRAKVGVVDPTGSPVAGARQITVYSWSVLRS